MNSPAGQSPLSFHRAFRWGALAAQLLAAAYLVGILATAIYMVFAAWGHASEFTWVGQAVLLFILPALVYQLGFFHYFPELLGRSIPSVRSLEAPVRWARWLRISQWVFVPFVFLFWILLAAPADILNRDSIEIYWASAFWVLMAVQICAVLRHYLGLNWRGADQTSTTAKHPFTWLAEHPSPEIALPLGAVLVLMSLGLYSSLSGWGSGERGLKIITGTAPWITAEHLPHAYSDWKQFLFRVGSGFYVSRCEPGRGPVGALVEWHAPRGAVAGLPGTAPWSHPFVRPDRVVRGPRPLLWIPGPG